MKGRKGNRNLWFINPNETGHVGYTSANEGIILK
jgi:hypothetical protein